MTAKIDILDITYGIGVSREFPNTACYCMSAKAGDIELYAEICDDWDKKRDYLLSKIIDLTEYHEITFNEIRVNGEIEEIGVWFDIVHHFCSRYFEDARVYAKSMTELKNILDGMQKNADRKIDEAYKAGEIGQLYYVNAPTYQGMARYELTGGRVHF